MARTKTEEPRDPKTKMAPRHCGLCNGTGVLSDRGGINRNDCPDCKGTGYVMKRVKADAPE